MKAPDFTGYLPAADFTPVDTTGAADAFIAGAGSVSLRGVRDREGGADRKLAAGFCVSRRGDPGVD